MNNTNGLCIYSRCNNFINVNHSTQYCDKHHDYHIRYNLKRRKIWKENNKCQDCGKDLSYHSVIYCNQCLEIHKSNTRRHDNGGLDPYNLSENIEMNSNKLGIKILGEA